MADFIDQLERDTIAPRIFREEDFSYQDFLQVFLSLLGESSIEEAKATFAPVAAQMRLSRIELHGAHSPRNHAKAMARFMVKQKLWPIELCFEIESGYLVDRHSRPKAEALHERIACGELRVRGIVTYVIDRYTRNVEVGTRWLGVLERAGVDLYEAESDLAPPLEVAKADYYRKIVSAWEYSNSISRKVNLAFAEMAAEGRPLGGVNKFAFGHRPFRAAIEDRNGNLVERTVGARAVEDEALIIYELAMRFFDGEGLADIVTDFKARGIKTRKGNLFKVQTARTLLRQHRLFGGVKHKGKLYPETGEGTAIDPIITRAVWEAIQERLRANARSKTRAGRYVGTGFLRCSCGRGLTRSSTDGYGCSSLNDRYSEGRVSEAPTESHVTVQIGIADTVLRELCAAALHALANEPAEPTTDVDARKAELSSTIKAERAKKANYSEQHAAGIITLTELKQKAEDIAQRIARAEAEKIELERESAMGTELGRVSVDDFRTVWRDATTSEAWKRSWVSRLLRHVDVAPAERRGSGQPHELRFKPVFKSDRQPREIEVVALLEKLARERLASQRDTNKQILPLQTEELIWNLHDEMRLSVGQIVNHLNDTGVQTRRGGSTWYDSGVRTVLKRAAARHGKDLVFQQKCKSPLSADVHNTIYELRSEGKQYKQVAFEASKIHGLDIEWWQAKNAYCRELKRRGEVDARPATRRSKTPPWLRDQVMRNHRAGMTDTGISNWLNTLAETNPEATAPRGGRWWPASVSQLIARTKRDQGRETPTD